MMPTCSHMFTLGLGFLSGALSPVAFTSHPQRIPLRHAKCSKSSGVALRGGITTLLCIIYPNHTVDGKNPAIPKFFEVVTLMLPISLCEGRRVKANESKNGNTAPARQSWKRVQGCCVIVSSHIAHASAQCRSPLVFRMHCEEFLQPWLQAKTFQCIRLQFSCLMTLNYYIFGRACFFHTHTNLPFASGPP